MSDNCSNHVAQLPSLPYCPGLHAIVALLLAVTTIAGCRGSDETDISDPRFPITSDPDAFAAFLNPLPGVPRDGAGLNDIDNVNDFPEAYYNTIDPENTRDTLQKWRLENGFVNPDGSLAACDPGSCRETHVKFRDTKDLGYGRNMFMRWNTVTNDIAVYVENFQVDEKIPYGPLNFEALINNDRQWNFGVNAIEFSAFPYTQNTDRKYTKFYNFAGDGNRATDPSGTQQHFVDLDNRGSKPMPNTCIVCHGGRGRALVVDSDDGKRKIAPTLAGGIAGDVQAHMQTIEFDTLQFANEPGFTRAENEEGIQLINEAILSTYQYRNDKFTGDGDWSADLAIKVLEGRYDGDPGNRANRYSEAFVPSGWTSDQNLYRSLVGPNCAVCHSLRGTIANDSVGFSTLAGFRQYAARVDHLIYEQGKMPLGLLNYANFWDSTNKDPAIMATALGLQDRVDSGNKAIRPGAPVAVIVAPPVATGFDASSGIALDIAISGAGSAFASVDGHRWQVSPAEGASVIPTGPSGDATLRVSLTGDYVLTLTVNGANGGEDSASQIVKVADSAEASTLLPGSAVTFFGAGGISELLGSGESQANCVQCHAPVEQSSLSSMPIHYTTCRSDAFNGNEFLYRNVLARVNFDSPLDSLFLRKPANGATDVADLVGSQINNYHAGNRAFTSDAQYSLVLGWILNGAPSGTVPPASSISATAPVCIP